MEDPCDKLIKAIDEDFNTIIRRKSNIINVANLMQSISSQVYNQVSEHINEIKKRLDTLEKRVEVLNKTITKKSNDLINYANEISDIIAKVKEKIRAECETICGVIKQTKSYEEPVLKTEAEIKSEEGLKNQFSKLDAKCPSISTLLTELKEKVEVDRDEEIRTLVTNILKKWVDCLRSFHVYSGFLNYIKEEDPKLASIIEKYLPSAIRRLRAQGYINIYQGPDGIPYKWERGVNVAVIEKRRKDDNI